MSSEIVKKRGRPKKVIPNPVEPEMAEVTKKTTTRAKSTKATTSKVTKAKAATPAKVSPSKAAISKPAASSLPPQKAARTPSVPNAKVEPQTPPPAPIEQSPKSPVTPETSKILSQVRELSQKPIPVGEEAAKSSKPSPTTITSKSTSTAQTKPSATKASKPASPAPKTNTSSPTPLPAPKPNPPPPSSNPTPTPKPRVPLASLNAEIVSNITTRAGARPNTSGSRALPPNYKPVARKVTMAIVAAPIAIVTSYILYERLVLGRERKFLVGPVEPGPEVEFVPSTSTPSDSA